MPETKQWLANIGHVIDAKDAQGFANFITENGTFRFGNQPDVVGRDAIRDYVAAFFTMIHSSEHAVVNHWKGNGTIVWQGQVNYTRLDDRKVLVPFTNIFYMDGDLIKDYLIYIDNTPLFAA